MSRSDYSVDYHKLHVHISVSMLMMSLISMFMSLLVGSRHWPVGGNPRMHALSVLLQFVKRICFASWPHNLFVDRTSAAICWLCDPTLSCALHVAQIIFKHAFFAGHCLESNRAVHVVFNVCQGFDGVNVVRVPFHLYSQQAKCVLSRSLPCLQASVRGQTLCGQGVSWKKVIGRSCMSFFLFFALRRFHSTCTLQ